MVKEGINMSTVEFKYEVTPDNTIAQLAGELRGLKPLNRSRLIPQLNSNKLVIEVSHLDHLFFGPGCNDCSRDVAFELLQETFSQTTIWAKLTSEDNDEVKMTIPKTTIVERIADDDKLIISIPVEIVK